MSRKNQDVKRQLFKNITGSTISKTNPSAPPSSPLDESASKLLSRTLRKQSDRFTDIHDISPHSQRYQKEFVVHNTTPSEQYKIFSSTHPIRESKLIALETAEKAFENLFHPDKHNLSFLNHSFNPNYSVYDSSSDEEDSGFPDISNLPQQSEYYEEQDDIILSIPGCSKEEILAVKRLHPKDRKNLKLPKQNGLESGFHSQTSLKYLRGLTRNELHEYHMLFKEFKDGFLQLESFKQRKQENQRRFINDIRKRKHHIDFEDGENMHLEAHQVQSLRESLMDLETTNWMFNKKKF